MTQATFKSAAENLISIGICELRVDVDGVILNSRLALATFAEKLLGYPLKLNYEAERGYQFLGLEKDKYEEILHHPDQIAQEKPFIEGVKDSFILLRKAGFQIDLLTSIKPEMIATREIQLRDSGLSFGTMLTVPREASKIEYFSAAAPAIVIDDYPHHVRDANAAGCFGVIFDQPYNKAEEGLRLMGWNEKSLTNMLETVRAVSISPPARNMLSAKSPLATPEKK
jgi:hypothetical protein